VEASGAGGNELSVFTTMFGLKCKSVAEYPKVIKSYPGGSQQGSLSFHRGWLRENLLSLCLV